MIKTDHVVTALFLTDVYIAVGDALGHLTLYSHMGYKAATKRITLKSIQSIYMSINDTSILLGYKGELAICQYNWKEKAINASLGKFIIETLRYRLVGASVTQKHREVVLGRGVTDQDVDGYGKNLCHATDG